MGNYQFFPKYAKDSLPPLYSQDGLGKDATVHVKFFDPLGSWSWFATEASAILEKEGEEDVKYVALTEVDEHLADGWTQLDVIFFGWVDGSFPELGNFSLNELQSVKAPWGGQRIERDIHWTPKPLGEVQGEQKVKLSLYSKKDFVITTFPVWVEKDAVLSIQSDWRKYAEDKIEDFNAEDYTFEEVQ